MATDYRESWLEEKQSAFLYSILTKTEKGTPREKMFRELARHAETQAGHWHAIAARAGQELPSDFHPSLLLRLVALLIRIVGPTRILPVLAGLKVRGLSAYTEKAPFVLGHATPTSVAEVGKRHNIKGSAGNIRAAVFGINDGLVSNAGLILGVAAAASFDTQIILVSGTAGLLAGALSMASGEYVSVRSQRELLEYQLALEKAELEQYPDEEAQELALIYEARGLPEEQAMAVARQLISNPQHALNTLAREELGLDPDDLASPAGAAVSSFVAFSVGAAIPLLPFIVSAKQGMIAVSIGVTAITLFLTGAVVSLFSGRRIVASGLRMLLIGGGAGLVTYLIGNLMG